MLNFCFILGYFSFIFFLTLFVVFTNDIIYSLLSLILIFVFTGFFFVFLGLEYLGFLFFVIYVGAISIIFLFVVMLLDLRNVSLVLRTRVYEFFFLLVIIGCFIIYGFIFLFFSDFDFYLVNFFYSEFGSFFFYFDLRSYTIEVFGDFLYNYFYMYVYFLAFYLLLVVLVLLLIIFFRYSY